MWCMVECPSYAKITGCKSPQLHILLLLSSLTKPNTLRSSIKIKIVILIEFNSFLCLLMPPNIHQGKNIHCTEFTINEKTPLHPFCHRKTGILRLKSEDKFSFSFIFARKNEFSSFLGMSASRAVTKDNEEKHSEKL